MNFYEPQSLFTLWLSSFKIANRTLARLILLAIVLFVPLGALVALDIFLGIKGSSKQLLLLTVGITLFYYLFLLLASQLIAYRLVDADVSKSHESMSEHILNSLLPAVYFFVYALLVGIISVGVAFVANFTRSPIFVWLVNTVFFLTVTLRIKFAPMAIATREMGPIEAFVYSWRLTSGINYLKVLGMFIMNYVLPLVTICVVGAIAYGAYIGIPLYFADSFDITKISLIWFLLVGIVACLLSWFIGWCMFIFPFLVFFNLDACHTEEKWGDETEIIQDGRDVNVYATQNTPMEEPEMEDLTIEQSAVKTEIHSDNLQEHLDQVYKPHKADIIQYAEEDRMPTILFDDEMAKQLEENRKMLMPNKNKSDDTSTDEGPSSIKISK